MTLYQLNPADGPSAPVDEAACVCWLDIPCPADPSDIPQAARPTGTDGPSVADEPPAAAMDEPRPVIADALPVPTGTAPSTTPDGPAKEAAQDGSALKRTAAAAWTGATYLGHGLRHSVTAGVRHVRAHDHHDANGSIKNEGHLALVQAVRKDRVRFLRNTAIAVAAGTMVGMEFVGWILPAVEAGVAAVGIGAIGRQRLTQTRPVQAPTHPAVAPGGHPAAPTRQGAPNIVAPSTAPAFQPAALEDDGDPFPLALCTTEDQARECLARALRAQGIRTSELTVTRRYEWGWEYDITLKGKGSTSSTVNSKLGDLETDMHLPEGGFMPETDSANMAHLTIRARIGDPFAAMPAPTVHEPRSLSVHQLIAMGWDITGQEFALHLDGFFGAVVGAMGAGKTLGALRTLAEAITACVDAVLWDLDPVKGGLDEFGDLAELRARGPEECHAALERIVAYIEARGRIFRRLGMGDRWRASAEHPALFAIIDEYIYLPKESKALAIKAIRLGRQYGIYIVFAGQELTEDAAGDAIGALLAWVVLMSCRPEDIRIALGPGQMARGWRPDRLVPSAGPITNDAGKSFIRGGAFTRPIQRRFWAYSPQQIAAAIPGRLAAGMTRMDADTLREAGEKVTADGRQMSLADQVDALATEHGATDGPVISALLRLFHDKAVRFVASSVLIEHLAAERVLWAGVEVDGDRLGRILRAHAPGAVVSRPTIDGRQVRGWFVEDVTRAAEGLLDPSRARQSAA